MHAPSRAEQYTYTKVKSYSIPTCPSPKLVVGLEPHSEGRAWGCKLQLRLRRSYTDVGGTPSRAQYSARRA